MEVVETTGGGTSAEDVDVFLASEKLFIEPYIQQSVASERKTNLTSRH